MTKHLTTLAGGVLLGTLLAVPSVSAQQVDTNATPGTSPGNSVDMSIGDRDPRAASLRRVEPGNAQFSFGNRLTVADFNVGWSPFDPASPTATDFTTGLVHSQGYQYRSPGLRALIDRPEYAPLRTGGEVLVIPANTVFQLTPERTVRPGDSRPAAHDNFRDHRLDGDPSANATTRSSNHPAAASFPNAPAFQNLRLERVPVSELRPIPHPSQMRFPQAAYPNGYVEPSTAIPVDRSVNAGSESKEDSPVDPEVSDDPTSPPAVDSAE